MLPGFRFLFAAIVLSMSVLIFGLGAAALLRSAHEEFASLPSRRAPAEQVFTRQNDPPMPTLALLRFDPPALDNKPLENGPAAAASETVPPAEQAPDATPAEPEKLAALKPEEPMPAAAPTPEISAVDTTAATPVTPAEAAAPIDNEDVKVAAIADTPEPSTTAPAPATDRSALEGGNIAATKIATLGGPAVIIDEKTVASATDAKPDRGVVRKRNAQRARERRRIAARRARLAARQAAAAAAQQQANPFGQTATARATR
jgi:hypothetical protein